MLNTYYNDGVKCFENLQVKTSTLYANNKIKYKGEEFLNGM